MPAGHRSELRQPQTLLYDVFIPTLEEVASKAKSKLVDCSCALSQYCSFFVGFPGVLRRSAL